MQYTNTRIYRINGKDIYISLSEPPSTEQIVRALKAEGLIRRNDRFGSYALFATETGALVLSKRNASFTLELCE